MKKCKRLLIISEIRLYLAKVASQIEADRIVFAGVEFMGESAKILNPNKKVLMPDAFADCPMAHMITIKEIKEMREKYDDLAVVCYINSTAEIKQYADVCVTSSNAVKIVKALPQKNIFFIPDQNLEMKKIISPENVMTNYDIVPVIPILLDKLMKQKQNIQRLKLHPECGKRNQEAADFVEALLPLLIMLFK